MKPVLPLSSPVGLGFRPVHYCQVLNERPDVGWFEVVSENFINLGGSPRYYLEKLRELYPIVCHGIGLNIGSTDPLDAVYLKKLKELTSVCEPFLVTDHLCWTSHHNHNSHDLLPLPYTEESLSHITRRLDQVQNELGRRILLENPSAYIGFSYSTLSEAEFLMELTRRTGCGILLDVNNLYVNTCNLGTDPMRYLETLPLDAVGQFHLSGHSINPDVRIDTHDHPIDDRVWDLFQLAVNRWPKAPALVEWDDHIPPLDELLQVVEKAKALHAKGLSLTSREMKTLSSSFPSHWSTKKAPLQSAVSHNLHETQAQFIDFITGSDAAPSREEFRPLIDAKLPVKADVGIDVYRNAYFLRIRDVMRELFEGFAFLVEEGEGFDTLIADYLKKHPPSQPSINEVGRSFASYLESDDIPADFGVPNDLVSDIVRLEWLQIEAFDSVDEHSIECSDLGTIPGEVWPTVAFNMHSSIHLLTARCNAKTILLKLQTKELPEAPKRETHHYIVCRSANTVEIHELSDAEMRAAGLLKEGRPFFEVASCFAAQCVEGADDAAAQEAVSFLMKLCNFHALTSWRNVEEQNYKEVSFRENQ